MNTYIPMLILSLTGEWLYIHFEVFGIPCSFACTKIYQQHICDLLADKESRVNHDTKSYVLREVLIFHHESVMTPSG